MRVRTQLTESLLDEMAMDGSEYPAVVKVFVQGIHTGDVNNPSKLITQVQHSAPGSVGKRIKYDALSNELTRQILKDTGLVQKFEIPESFRDAVERVQEIFRNAIIKFMTYMERTGGNEGSYGRYM